MFTALSNKKKLVYWLGLPVALLGIFLLVQPAEAGIGETLMVIVGWLVLPIVHFLGNVLLLLIEILISVFKFTDFIDSAAVQLGWVILRDLANIGIVVALVIIAFSTVFRIERYAVSKLLVKLIIAAFLVNFSLVIAGFIIDFGQVIMMTFVNAFDKLAAGNLTVGFGIEEMLRVSTSVANNPSFDSSDGFAVIGAMLLAVTLLVVAIAVVLVIIFVLLQRIIFLWILAIFSPIAWVAPLLPGGEKWSSQWWDNFSKQVFIGPVLAFGFWLSMSILAGLSSQQHLISLQQQSDAVNLGDGLDTTNLARFVSEVSTPQAIFDFMITIALLMGTVWMARQAGGAAGTFAGNMSSRLEKAPGRLLGGLGKKATRPITDRYAAYRADREAVRKESVARAGRRLGAYHDLTLGRVTGGLKQAGASIVSGGKWRTKAGARAVGRGRKTKRDIFNEDIATYQQLYNFNKMGRQQGRDMMVSGKDSKGKKVPLPARILAGMRAAYGEGTFEVDAHGSDDAQTMFELLGDENHLPDWYQKYEDTMKKTNPKALLGTQSFMFLSKFDPKKPNQEINGFTIRDAAQELGEEVMNQNITEDVLNDEKVRQIVKNAPMDDKRGRSISGGISAYMFEIAPTAVRLKSVLNGLNKDAIQDLLNNELGNYFREENNRSNGAYYKKNKSKLWAVADAGAADVAFMNLDDGYRAEYTREQFIEDRKERSKKEWGKAVKKAEAQGVKLSNKNKEAWEKSYIYGKAADEDWKKKKAENDKVSFKANYLAAPEAEQAWEKYKDNKEKVGQKAARKEFEKEYLAKTEKVDGQERNIYEHAYTEARTKASQHENYLEEYLKIDKNRSSLLQNMTKTSMENPGFLNVLQKYVPRALIERIRDNKEQAPTLEKSVVSQISANGAKVDDLIKRGRVFVDNKGNLVEKVANENKYIDEDGNEVNVKNVRSSKDISKRDREKLKDKIMYSTIKYTDNIIDNAGNVVEEAFDLDNMRMRRWGMILNRSMKANNINGEEINIFEMENKYAQDALAEFIKKGRVVGTNFRNNKLDPDDGEDAIAIKIMADNMRSNDIAQVAERNEELGKMIVNEWVKEYDRLVAEGKTIEAKDIISKLRNANRNPNLTGTIPGRILERG